MTARRAAELNIEEFLKDHQYTISALSTFGTLAAVVVALFGSVSALRTSRTRIRAHAGINVIHHSSMEEERPKYLVVTIQNLGTMSVHIPMGFLRWKAPFQRVLEQLPHDYSAADEWVPQKKYPVEIKPRGSELFFLSSIQMLRENAHSDTNGIIGTSRWRRLCSRFLRAWVCTDDGRLFRVTFGESLRKELAALRKGQQAV